MPVTEAISDVTDTTFADDVLGQDLPVLVEFWATWCPPCRMLSPVLEAVARERAGSLVVRKMNSDENPETVRAYRVMSLPTMILFRDGVPVRSFVGARPKLRVDEDIDAALA